MLETFFGFVAVVAFFVVDVFFEGTLGLAAFLTVGFKAAFALDFLGAATLLGFSTASLEIVFVFSAADFLTAFAVVLLDLSPTEVGFLVIEFFLVEAGFLF